LSGASGSGLTTTQRTGSGQGVRPLKLKTTSSIGELFDSLDNTPVNSIADVTYSLGEKYGLRIIPGQNSFLVLPNNVSRSSAVGSILAPGGPVTSPIVASPRSMWFNIVPSEDTDLSTDIDFVLTVSGDEKLLRRLSELEFAETVSVTAGEGSAKYTAARWRLEKTNVLSVLSQFAVAK
jgi:trehalose 6-phosphate synthase/phosphatase